MAEKTVKEKKDNTPAAGQAHKKVKKPVKRGPKIVDKGVKVVGEEKIYNISLRRVKVKSYRKRTPYGVRLVRAYLAKHTKNNNVKIGKYLNEYLWRHGIEKPPAHVRVRAIRDGDTIKAELVGKDYFDFVSKKREERGGGLMDKMRKRMTPKEIQKQAEEELIEGKKTDEKKQEVKEEAKQ